MSVNARVGSSTVIKIIWYISVIVLYIIRYNLQSRLLITLVSEQFNTICLDRLRQSQDPLIDTGKCELWVSVGISILISQN